MGLFVVVWFGFVLFFGFFFNRTSWAVREGVREALVSGFGRKSPLEQAVGFFFSSPSRWKLKTCRIDNIQADVFSCLYSEHDTAAGGTLGGILMGRMMETTALFTLMSSGLVLKKTEEFYFWGCSPPCDYENVLAEFIVCCSDQEGPGPQYQMQVILLSVTLVLPLRGRWPSTCISKCFGKEDGTVQGLGDGRGGLKEPLSYKSKISILCYRIPIEEWYVKESILKAVQLQKHVLSMQQGCQGGWAKSLNSRYDAGHTLSVEPALPGAQGCISAPPRGHSTQGPAHGTVALFPLTRPCFDTPTNRGKHQNHRQKQGKRQGPWQPRTTAAWRGRQQHPSLPGSKHSALEDTGQLVLEHS